MEFSLFWTLRTTILWARTTSLRLWRWMQIFSQSLPMQGSPSKAGDMRLISSCMTSCRLNEAWSVHCIHCPKLCDIYTISSLYGWLSVQMPRMSSQLFVHVCLSSSTECDTVRFDDLFHDHCTIYAIAIVKYHAVCVCYTAPVEPHTEVFGCVLLFMNRQDATFNSTATWVLNRALRKLSWSGLTHELRW